MAVLVAVALTALGPPQAARSSDDLAGSLVRETVLLIRDQALSPPPEQVVLAQALAAVRALAAGPSAPAPPALVGDPDRDRAAVAAYVGAVVALAPRDAERIVLSVLAAMVRAVDDRYGAVFTPSELSVYLGDLRGEASGVGVQVESVGGHMTVLDVTPGGPADRAGVRSGDVLVAVDGVSTAGETADQTAARLRGPEGSTVSVTVRAGAGDRTVVVRRERVRHSPVRWRMVDSGVGYLRLLEFTEGAGRDTDRALQRLQAAGADGLVLDLRDNSGGWVDEAVEVASLFLAEGIVAMEQRRDSLTPLAVTPALRRFAGPLVVLVNLFSASASEIVAGALQDEGVPLVGSRTFGKSTVQTIFPLREGWGVRLTTARYYTRRGRSVERAGLTPDVVVPMDGGLIGGLRDPQAQRAVVMLRAALVGRRGP
jgi:carboxyl-terminal processing protease